MEMRLSSYLEGESSAAPRKAIHSGNLPPMCALCYVYLSIQKFNL
jgi:hypothetical protein